MRKLEENKLKKNDLFAVQGWPIKVTLLLFFLLKCLRSAAFENFCVPDAIDLNRPRFYPRPLSAILAWMKEGEHCTSMMDNIQIIDQILLAGEKEDCNFAKCIYC